MSWTAEQKAFIVSQYLKTDSYVEARIAFQRRYNLHKRNVPSYLAVYRWTKSFKACGTIQGHVSVDKHSSLEKR